MGELFEASLCEEASVHYLCTQRKDEYLYQC